MIVNDLVVIFSSFFSISTVHLSRFYLFGFTNKILYAYFMYKSIAYNQSKWIIQLLYISLMHSNIKEVLFLSGFFFACLYRCVYPWPCDNDLDKSLVEIDQALNKAAIHFSLLHYIRNCFGSLNTWCWRWIFLSEVKVIFCLHF